MFNRSRLCTMGRAAVVRLARLVTGALLLAVGLSVVMPKPAYGRWEVPQTEAEALEAQTSSRELAVATPDWITRQEAIPRQVALPDQVRVPILMYHYVSDLPGDADVLRRDLTVEPHRFEAQMQYLVDEGYHTITLVDVFFHLTQGYPLPEKPIVLTFDDGYVDAYEVVFPSLLDRGFTGTFFVLVTPTHFESPDYITWAQMKEMSDAGMDIQAHGRDHIDLRGLSYDYLVYQTVGVQEAVHFHTGRLPRFFCYPSGQYNENVIGVLKSAGYWGAVTTQWGRTHTRDALFEMSRVRIRGADTLASFISKIED